MATPKSPFAVLAVIAYAIYRIGKGKGKAEGKKEGKEIAESKLEEKFKQKTKEELREEAEDEFYSEEAHQRATDREPPVEIGEEVTVGVTEFKNHHSGNKVAVCKYNGFVIFVDRFSDNITIGDSIKVKITSFGRNKNSAEGVPVNYPSG